MKIATVFGTRPEIIRLSEIIKALNGHCEQTLVHTGQNYDANLSDIFFEDLGLRQPDVHLGIRESNAFDQIGQMFSQIGKLFNNQRPDRLLILGDTNSALSAIVAARMGIPVFHIEAGNRCYDNRVPEEVNRRIIDHCSDILMPYTHRAKEGLLREGIERKRIFVVGNPIYEVWNAHWKEISVCRKGNENILVTMHRAENVNDAGRLSSLWRGLDLIGNHFSIPVLVSLHPHTKDRMTTFGIAPLSPHIQLLEPLGFLDFAGLMLDAKCVITDSGTVQEECCIYHIPSVTIRDVTERPETVECGSSILTGCEPSNILKAAQLVTESMDCHWNAPQEYMEPYPSRTIARIVLGYHGLA